MSVLAFRPIARIPSSKQSTCTCSRLNGTSTTILGSGTGASSWFHQSPGLAASYENVAQLVDLLLLHQCRAHHSTDDPTPGLLLVLASRLTDEITLVLLPSYNASSRTMVSLLATICDPLSVPSLRIADGSIVTFLSLFTLLSFLLSSSTSESDGQLGSPRRVHRCGILLLARLLLVLLCLYLPSRVCALIRYGWYCGWWRCSKVPVRCSFFGSLLDSPFFRSMTVPCWTPSLLAAAVSPCAAPFFSFLGLAVLGWRFYCIRHRFTSAIFLLGTIGIIRHQWAR